MYFCTYASLRLVSRGEPPRSGGTAARLLTLGRISRMYVSVFVLWVSRCISLSLQSPLRMSGAQVCGSTIYAMNHESITVSLPISVHAVRRQPTKSAPIVLQSQEEAMSREEPYLLRHKYTETYILRHKYTESSENSRWGIQNRRQFHAVVTVPCRY